MIGGFEPRVLNINPLVMVVDGFASAEDCETIVSLVERRLKPSAVVDKDGRVGRSEYRTNSDGLLRPNRHPALMPLLMKLGMLMRLPIDQAEAFNVLHYLPGQEFKPHDDAFNPQFIERHGEAYEAVGGQRLFSTMIYLNDVEEGGATSFPRLDLSVAARQGRLLVFSNTLPGSDTADPLAQHAGEPVIQGEKWAAIAWWRRGTYSPVMLEPEESL